MNSPSPNLRPAPEEPPAPVFGVNEVRLNARQWLVACLVVLGVALSIPSIWKRLEPLDAGPDYRIPYTLSRDYWLYGRRLEQVHDPRAIVLLGDSVIWGEYVRPEGTLGHFLDQESGTSNRFINAGVNGMFPLALEGLVTDYGRSLDRRKVVLHCNLLWMSSPKADLSTEKEEAFNHPRLVPQFQPRLPCYRADTSERIGALFERSVGFLQWVGHLESAYFGQKSIPLWTLADDGGDPPAYPNTFRCPISQVSLRLPDPFAPDPERGPTSPRHRPWDRAGGRPVEFEWVETAKSLQWQAFGRVVERLRARGADVLVLVGPFNESMLTDTNRATYTRWREKVASWLKEQGVPAFLPAALPSGLYADASHPLTEGYALLAKQLWADPTFQAWAK